jgi:TfoX/Sxy family transcriptional regulator of competence genes
MSAQRFFAYVIEQLRPLGDVSGKAMFGGFGVWHGPDMFALISQASRLYFRVSEESRWRYEAANAEQFMSMPYMEVPADVFENTDKRLAWAREAAEVAHAAGARKKIAKAQKKVDAKRAAKEKREAAKKKAAKKKAAKKKAAKKTTAKKTTAKKTTARKKTAKKKTAKKTTAKKTTAKKKTAKKKTAKKTTAKKTTAKKTTAKKKTAKKKAAKKTTAKKKTAKKKKR